MNKLLKKQKALKGKITHVKTIIDAHDVNPISEADVEIYTEKMRKFYQENEHLYEEIILQCKDDVEMAHHEVPYNEEDARIHQLRSALLTISKSFAASPATTNRSGSKPTDVRLPKLDPPTFSGNVQEWISFQDLFTACVHSNTQLSNAQKLQYLKASMKGDAALLIQSLPVTDANYDEAWKMLENRCLNKRDIIKANLDRLFSQQNIQQENPSALRKLVDTTTECVRAFSVLKIPSEKIADIIFIYLISKKLDSESRLQWERSLKVDTLPSVQEFCTFLDHHSRVTAAAKCGVSKPKVQTGTCNEKTSTSVHHSTTDTSYGKSVTCDFCTEVHPTFKCNKLKSLTVSERVSAIKQKNLCFNCLRGSHSYKSCPSERSCLKCKKKHHTLLHLDLPSPLKNPEQPAVTSQPGAASQTSSETASNLPAVSTMHVRNTPSICKVLLSTAIIEIVDVHGHRQKLRALLDNGAEATIITEQCISRLGLKRFPAKVPLSGLSSVSVGSSQEITKLNICSPKDNSFFVSSNALILPSVTGLQPHRNYNPKQWSHLKNLQLADPDFHKPSQVDILLGVDVYGDTLLEGIVKGKQGTPTAIKTVFGWIVTGKVTPKHYLPVSVNLCHLEPILQKFWELEEVPKKIALSPEEIACENHLNETHSRDSSGRYMVRLPFRPHLKPFGESRQSAIIRLKQMERRFSRNPELQQRYSEVIEEYLSLHHMEEVPTPSQELDNLQENISKGIFDLPHHAVFNEASSTTKLRVVFDGSAKTTTGVSLNETLMVGPKLQDDLTAILIRFRCHRVAFTADIAKMYRQFRVHKDDADFQRIVWRKSPEEEIKNYRLLTATFGTSAAPYLAIKCVQQLAKDEEKKFPAASFVLLRDLYVDDLMSGANSEMEAIKLQAQLLQLMQLGQLELRKWSSNSEALLKSLSPELCETKLPLRIDTDETVKTLGILWNPAADHFSFSVVPPPERETTTKRSLLSDLAKVFDPLGWLSPTTIKAKILFQSLWKCDISWDNPLPQDIADEWKDYTQNLSAIENIRVERYFLLPEHSTNELHGYCDASEKAYAAAVYIRSIDSHGGTKVNLIAAKTKVAPLKQVSLPRLELCGAVLLTRLMEVVRDSLHIEISSSHYWTDSTIVLAWIASPAKRWMTFVANRVAEIQSSTVPTQWKHVSGEINPADCASRGIPPGLLETHPLWWNGPPSLRCSDMKISIPCLNPPSESEQALLEERKVVSVTHVTVCVPKDRSLLSKYSSWTTLTRVTAYCRRFIHNFTSVYCSRKNLQPKRGLLTLDELNSAKLFWIQATQCIEFQDEMQALTKKQPLPTKSKLMGLRPFLDDVGILRVGGRLRHSKLTPDRKFPILLPRKSPLTNLIVRSYHLQSLHAGPLLLLATLQRTFWILCGRDVVRQVVRKCIPCHRQSAVSTQQIMGDLPVSRVTQTHPFSRCGVDYAGPMTLRVLKGRGQKTFKGYIAVFVCFVTRAMHLEVVSDLTTDSFLAALKRFVSRRGRPTDIFSDCGTNFVGANRELQHLLKLTQSQNHQEEVSRHLISQGIQWHFNPGGAPTFGGIWEAGVKSVKYHLRRIIGNVNLTFEEMSTVLCQVEACLNSRPLTALSGNPEDMEALTPGHFLVGKPLTAIPEPEYSSIQMNRLSRWQLTQKLLQHFWNRWSSEYLARLQHRPKWWKEQKNLAVGDLALIKDENLPPLEWKLARVLQTHPGKDNLLRVVTLKTAGGTLQRPVGKLSPLPIDTESQDL